MAPYATIVVGASSGGVEALQRLASGLPPDIPAAIFVVQHIGPYPSSLPHLMKQAGRIPASHAQHLQMIEPGHIYIAPPDHHVILGPSRIMLTRGPRENWARPAIDPLFRSAAYVFGTRVIGVILTGALNDGTAGLRVVRARGGAAVVQDPADATFPEMPRSALRLAGADHSLSLDKMSPLLGELSEAIVTGNSAKECLDRWRTAP